MNYSLKSLSVFFLLSAFAVTNCNEETVTRSKSFKSEKSRKNTSDFQRFFDVLVVFEQELFNPPAFGNSTPLPASSKPDDIFGRLELCFNKELSEVKFKLFVFNDENPTNPNALVTAAHLHLGRAGQNGPVAVLLFSSAQPCGEGVDGLLVEGTITNSNITPQLSPDGQAYVANVASLLDAIRRGEVYCNVHGNACNATPPVFTTGMIRGQVFTNQE